ADNGVFNIYDHSSGVRLAIETSGEVGIGTASPSTKLDVNGDVRADDFIEYSPFYGNNDALDQISGIQCINDTVGTDGWCDVDHKSLPTGVHVFIPETHLKHKTSGKVYTMNEFLTIENEVMEDYDTIIVDVDGRSLSSMVQLLVKGVQELSEENIILKQELCNKDDTYSFC
ncbi:MAG: hypothetical protein KKG04_02010, partial [Candidatus Thermoplasmatota archaeon]|nr:hypothetical protein [Candidatus Thermoplasmatota archaeon]